MWCYLQVKLNCLHPGLFPMLQVPSPIPIPHGNALPSLLLQKAEAMVSCLARGSVEFILTPIGYKHNLLPLRTRGGDLNEVVKSLDLEEVCILVGRSIRSIIYATAILKTFAPCILISNFGLYISI